MIFLKLEKINEIKAKVILVHKFPNDLTDKEKENGVLVENYIQEEGIPYYNYQTKQVYFEKSLQVTEIEELKKENEILGQLVSQGELERLEIGQTIANMELEILSLKNEGGVVNA